MPASAPALPPPSNRLLSALPPEEYHRLALSLEPVPLDLKTVLHKEGEEFSHVYFPTRGVVSLLTVLGGGKGIEVGLVGCEGVVGLPLFLGSATTPFRALVQVPGDALRVRADEFRARLRAAPGTLPALLAGYTHAFLTQVSQLAACNSQHSIEKRCCRWLLMTHDRVGADCFALTQEFLASMLGVRRASVSEVARVLQRARHVHFRRGRVTVLDRAGLEASACECYRLVRAEFARLLT